MQKKLLLMRHAEAVKSSHDDFNRELTTNGKSDAKKMAAWLADHNIIPDHIISSPALRAKQTSIIIAEHVGLDARNIEFEESMYDGSPITLLHLIKKCRENYQTVMLVGHSPVMEDLVGKLSTGKQTKAMHTSAIAHLDVNEEWSKLQMANLISIAQP